MTASRMQERRRHDGLQTLGLCAAVIAVTLILDHVLERRDWAATSDTSSTVQAEATRESASAAFPDVVITGFHYLHEVPKPAVTPLWELTSTTASLYEQRQEVTMRTIHAMFSPGQAGEASQIELNGAQGRLDLGRLNFDVAGSDRPVTVRLGGRYTLTTARLEWDNAAARMTTDQPVEIVGDGLIVTGVGFEWRQSDGTLSVLRDIHTKVTR
jgi:hypothetical protein